MADGASVTSGQAFAEVEVMKMYMTLSVPEAGVISLAKLEGTVLEPGELIATVSLDDPTKVHKVRYPPWIDCFPELDLLLARKLWSFL